MSDVQRITIKLNGDSIYVPLVQSTIALFLEIVLPHKTAGKGKASIEMLMRTLEKYTINLDPAHLSGLNRGFLTRPERITRQVENALNAVKTQLLSARGRRHYRRYRTVVDNVTANMEKLRIELHADRLEDRSGFIRRYGKLSATLTDQEVIACALQRAAEDHPENVGEKTLAA